MKLLLTDLTRGYDGNIVIIHTEYKAGSDTEIETYTVTHVEAESQLLYVSVYALDNDSENPAPTDTAFDPIDIGVGHIAAVQGRNCVCVAETVIDYAALINGARTFTR